MRRRRRVAALLLGSWLCAGAGSQAALATTLSGTVRDDGGRPLPGVTIDVRGDGLSAPKILYTDANGSYQLDGLSASTFQVSFRMPGFATLRKDVNVPSEGARLDSTLHLVASAEVVVTGKRTFRNLADLNEPVNDLLGIASASTVGVVTSKELDERESLRAADVLESVPGVVISQHSGEGKANQYYVRGFNIDHGTDLASTVAGVPVNMPTHAHGQGYSDNNFLIPELVSAIQYKKGPYYAEEGDFSAAGAINVNYVNVLDHPILKVDGGGEGYRRGLVAGSQDIGGAHVLYALEAYHNDGPWVNPDDYRKINGVLRYSTGDAETGFSLTGMAYQGRWNSTDQVAARGVAQGLYSAFGTVDPTDGGKSHRYTLSADWQHTGFDRQAKVQAYLIDYDLNLWSNFTYFLNDPVNGDQFEQYDRRLVTGLKASQQWLGSLLGLEAETTVGVQARNDNISGVGLYHTKGRDRLETIRNDHVRQTSGAVYAQSSIQWAPKVRTILGLRGDLYRFKVDSNLPENSGTEAKGIFSPKLSVILGPFANTEIYLNGGFGFHSNDGRGATLTRDPATGDPAERVSPLVRAKGAEVGVRTTAIPNVQTTFAAWMLDIDSELVFLGDAGITEPSRSSRRVGIEWATYWSPLSFLTLDAALAYSRARFTEDDPAGNNVPGAIEGVASIGLSVAGASGFSGSLRLRYFGPRALLENDSVRSNPSTLVNARVGYQLTRNVRLNVDVFNLFNHPSSDIDYYYASRLPGEPAEGVEDVHFHPVNSRTVRAGLVVTF